jgi:hypothetical protein
MTLSACDRQKVSTGTSSNTKHQELTPGCDGTTGNLRSTCNLVCFDVVRGLLTPTSGLGQMLVHHISVAEFATTVESVPANTYARRRILETVSPFGGMPAVGKSNMPAGIMNIVVQADPRVTDGTTTATTGATATTATTGATGNVSIATTDDDNDVNVAYMMTTYVLLGILIISGVVVAVYMARGNCNEGNRNRGGHSQQESYAEQGSYAEQLLHPSHGAYRRGPSSKV